MSWWYTGEEDDRKRQEEREDERREDAERYERHQQEEREERMREEEREYRTMQHRQEEQQQEAEYWEELRREYECNSSGHLQVDGEKSCYCGARDYRNGIERALEAIKEKK